MPDVLDGVKRAVDGDVLVDGGCWWLYCAQQEQPGAQFLA
jgi:hypothetical protein